MGRDRGNDVPGPVRLNARVNHRTMAELEAADFRTVVGITEQAIATFKKRNGAWPRELRAAFIDARRAALRGIGPVRHTAPFPFERVLELRDQVQARLEGGPLCPRRVDVIACSWLLREREAAIATVGDVRVENGHTVVFPLPVPKTDPSAIGVSRSHKCACGRKGRQLRAHSSRAVPRMRCDRAVRIRQRQVWRLGRPTVVPGRLWAIRLEGWHEGLDRRSG